MQNKFRKKLQDGSGFIVNVELTGGPGFNFAPIEKFLSGCKEAGISAIPEGFDFCCISVPQNPGGVANIDPANVLNVMEQKGLLDDLDFMPHISCKDHNSDALISSLVAYQKSGVESVLILTGDKPAKAKGVFDVESVGLLEMIKSMNNQSYIKAKPDALGSVHQFCAGAAVSPFKYTESSQMQQYYKMEKKIASGADFLITQVGWDWKKSLELFQYLKENDIDVPVIGNVYHLSTISPAPKLMHDIKLPGCFVSDDFLAKINSETTDEHIERTAQQVAMYKNLGAAGVDVGGVHDFDMFVGILSRAVEIGDGWREFKDNLCWPDKVKFYLYDDDGKRVALVKRHKKFNHISFNAFHNVLMEPKYKGFHIFRKTMSLLGTEKGKGFFYKCFHAFEKPVKYLLFDCEECGDCYLTEHFGWCTMGKCEKGLDNVPCGDSTADGYCGNNLERRCIGEYVYEAAMAEKGGVKKLREVINKPRKPELAHTASMLNYLFAKDHTKKSPLITVGEAIHASVPKTGAIMKQLADAGADAYTSPSGALGYIRALIESQGSDGADHILVNLDAFGKDGPKVVVDMMMQYVKMVRRWAGGAAICIDSRDQEVLTAGLKEWYNTDETVKQPLLSSVTAGKMDKVLELRRKYDFSVVGLLDGEFYSSARQIFSAAVDRFGFKAEQVFFSLPVTPLAGDTPQAGTAGDTYRIFKTIKKIKSDPIMKDAHFILSISNSSRDLPREVGVCRAYAAKAMEYGLDAGIVNTAHRYGMSPAAGDLLKLADAYAKMNGSAEKIEAARSLMDKLSKKGKKPKKPV